MPPLIDWDRLTSFVAKEAKTRGRPDRSTVVLDGLKGIAQQAGDFSCNRQMLVKIAKVLFSDQPVLIAPCCPDYGHRDGRYTFKGLGGGVSLLAQKQIAFLDLVCAAIPKISIMLMMADHEADDEEICRAVKTPRADFLKLIDQSIEATRAVVAPRGWQVECMTHVIKGLVAREQEAACWIAGQDGFRCRLTLDTINRSQMYRNINASLTKEEMLQRTIRTAAQYVALGRYATEQEWLVCNHTTVNLSWYLQVQTAVLHNPVCVY